MKYLSYSALTKQKTSACGCSCIINNTVRVHKLLLFISISQRKLEKNKIHHTLVLNILLTTHFLLMLLTNLYMLYNHIPVDVLNPLIISGNLV